MTPNDIADARCGLLDFTRIMFRETRGADLKLNPHQDAICDALERVVLGRIKRLIINVPPRSGKTELAVKNFMAWTGGLFPDSEFIHASYSKRLAASNTYAVRAIMQSEAYAEIFPWVKLKGDSTAKDEFRTGQGGVFYATGADGTITGYGAGRMRDGFGGAIIIDDPHKSGEATSGVMRQNVIDWFQMTMESRKNTPETPIIVIMQRLHQEDLSGWLLAGGNGEEWEHLVIPALTDDETSFWPEQFPLDMLQRQETASRYVFAGQYMQDPVPRGGAMFQREWFNITPAAPAGCRWVRGWDLAGSEGRDSAFTAGILMGRSQDGRYFIADATRAQVTGAGVERLIANTAGQDAAEYPGVRGSIPQDPGSAGKSWAQHLIKQIAPHNYRASTETGDKATRAEGLSAQAEGGNVYLVSGDWNKAFLDEITTFPVGKWKDQVDAASRAFSELVAGKAAKTTTTTVRGLY